MDAQLFLISDQKTPYTSFFLALRREFSDKMYYPVTSNIFVECLSEETILMSVQEPSFELIRDY